MYKIELVEKVARKSKVAKATVLTVVETLLEEITNSLKRGRRVTLKDFGTFRTRKRVARKSYSIQAGKKVLVRAHRVVHFKVGQGLKGLVK